MYQHSTTPTTIPSMEWPDLGITVTFTDQSTDLIEQGLSCEITGLLYEGTQQGLNQL